MRKTEAAIFRELGEEEVRRRPSGTNDSMLDWWGNVMGMPTTAMEGRKAEGYRVRP